MSVSKDEKLFSFIAYFELLKSKTKGFVYKLAELTAHSVKSLIAVIWQTATMRYNFEWFGHFIGLCMNMIFVDINKQIAI